MFERLRLAADDPAVQVLRDPQIISGFIFDEPVEDLAALTHCGEALCCRGHARPPHAHASFEFLYMSRGSASWRVSGRTYRQEMGDLFIAHPEERHSTGPRPNPENQHVWIGLHLDQLGRSGAKLARELQEKQLHLITACQEVEPLLRAIIGQVAALRPRRNAVVRSMLEAFLMMMLQILDTRGSPRERPGFPQLVPYSEPIRRAVAYMQDNLHRRIPLRDLAAVATARSAAQFCLQFRREVGLPPAAYHLQLRLQAAREILQQPAIDITTAAMMYGFSSSQHFSTVFRKSYRTTPRDWMRRARSGRRQ